MLTYELPIHFGNNEGRHEIDSDSLAIFIDAYKAIYEELTNNKINIEIGVPEEGGWKTVLAIIGGVISLIGIDNISIAIRGKPSSDIFYSINEAIVGFIAKEASDDVETYSRKCIEQKNKIYRQFKKDICIDSFDLAKLPPIPKANFDLYIKNLEDEENLYLGITNITVSSPDWKGKRSWRGKIEYLDEEETPFDFDKDLTGNFWAKVRLDTLPLHTTDTMKVQLIFRPSNRVKYRVIRVLSYNEIEIDTPLSDDDISKITSSVAEPNKSKKEKIQPDLFDDEKDLPT